MIAWQIFLVNNLVWVLCMGWLVVRVVRKIRACTEKSHLFQKCRVHTFTLWEELKLGPEGKPVFPFRVFTAKECAAAMSAVYFKESASQNVQNFPLSKRFAVGIVIDLKLDDLVMVLLVLPQDASVRVVNKLRQGMDLVKPANVQVRVTAGSMELK